MSEELNPVPPLAKEINETVIADATFDEQCGAYFVQMAKRQGWSIKHSLITHSDEWGRIWRADFDIKGIEYSTDLLNRLVCWEDNEGKGLTAHAAFGQRLLPLRNPK